VNFVVKAKRKSEEIAWRLAGKIFSQRTISTMKFDLVRYQTRRKRARDHDVAPVQPRLHLACGKRIIPGWLNVDLVNSNYDVDLGSGKLPWKDSCFEAIVSQHFIEHLELRTELIPLFCELRRVLVPGGELWLSCPDIEKVCLSYLNHKMVDLLEDRKLIWPKYSLKGAPSSHMINDFFHQGNDHKNLFDFSLLDWSLREAGFTWIKQVEEADLLSRFPDFPPRNDGKESLYIQAMVSNGHKAIESEGIKGAERS